MALAYRADIDGLRAIAVGSVVLFHGHIPPFSGGFIGVDVFFVISGFLITSILCRDIEARSFSLVDFYDRRIRRIFPALFTVLLGVTALAALVLLPKQMMQYAQSLIPSALFYANLHFARDLNYFGPSADETPLLHLWSLAVEEQFYIVFPILLFVLLRFAGRRLSVLALVAMAAGSLYYAQHMLDPAPEKSFYLLWSRAWELLVGAFLALVPLPKVPEKVAAWLAGLGLLAVLVPVFAYDRDTLFPGLAALPAVLGTALMIYAGGVAPLGRVSRVLSLPGFVYVGRISYSLYLWHWPLLVLCLLLKGRHLTYLQSGAVILFAVALSALSLKYIEEPLRRPGVLGGQRLRRIAAGAAAIAVVALGAVLLKSVNGQLWPVSPLGAAAEAAADDRSPFQMVCNSRTEPPVVLTRVQDCALGPQAGQGRYDAVVWGDSHAGASFIAFAEDLARQGLTTRLLTMPGCPPLVGGLARRGDSSGAACAEFNVKAMEEIKALAPKIVILAGRWSIWTSRATRGGFHLMSAAVPGGLERTPESSRSVFVHMMDETLTALRALGPRVVVLGQVPEYTYAPAKCVAQREYFGGKAAPCIDQSRESLFRQISFANDVITKASAAHPGTSVLLMSDIFCNDQACTAAEMARGKERFYYVDGDHLSATGARFARDDPRLRAALQAALQGAGQASRSGLTQ